MKNRLNTKNILLASVLGFGLNANTASADDGHLVFNTAAIHFKNFKDRNAFVPGIGWEYSPTGKVGFHAGTLSDSFGYQATYIGVNYGTRKMLNNRVRFLVGATVVRKQFHKNTDPEVKIVPFPVMEISLTQRAKINVSGSPEIDYAGGHSNGVMFFQFKMNLN